MYLIGMVGMNELIQYHTGEPMHASVDAMKFGLKIIANMKLLADQYSRKHNMRFVLEQTPAESTAYRIGGGSMEELVRHYRILRA